MDIKIKPKYKDSTVTFNVKYYDHEGDGSLMKVKIIFSKWSQFILRLTCLIIVLVQNFVAFMRYLTLIRKRNDRKELSDADGRVPVSW